MSSFEHQVCIGAAPQAMVDSALQRDGRVDVLVRAALQTKLTQGRGSIVDVASDDASFMTGALVPVDGGTSAQ